MKRDNLTPQKHRVEKVTMKETPAEVQWLRGGTVQEVVWIGQDTIGWCTGPYIVFYDVINKKLSLPKFPTETHKGGAACLSGHRTRGVFAFAEKNPNPQIFVHTYPDLERLCTCAKQTSYAYLATAFANDYLVTIGSLPDFQLSLWSWRSGEKLVSVESSILDAENIGQSLRISYLPRAYIAQIGNESGRLCTWEMLVSGDTAILSKNEIVLPNQALVRDVAWRPDSSNDVLAITDRDGHIYLSNAIGTEINRIVVSERSNVSNKIEPDALCWYRGGLVLRTTFYEIRYYIRDAANGGWKMLWSKTLEPYPCALTSFPLRNDRVYFFTKQGHIFRMDFDDKLACTLQETYFKGGRFKFLNFVHPWDEHLVCLDQDMSLIVISNQEGARVVKLDLNLQGEVTYMVSHQDYPLIIACTDGGEVIFVSLLHHNEPKILGKYLIQLEALQLLRFSKFGRYVLAGDKEQGICYLFNVHYTEPIRAVAQLEVHQKMADVLSFEVGNTLKIFLLVRSSTVASIGHRLYLYDYLKDTNEFKKRSTVFELGHCYTRLHRAPGDGFVFLGSPYLSKQMHFFKIVDWKDIVCYEIIPNGHSLRQIKMITNRSFMISSSLNGHIIVRAPNLRTGKHQQSFPIQIMLSTHHQRDSGITKISISNTGACAIILGYDGMIVSIPTVDLEKRVSEGLQRRRLTKEKVKKAHFVKIGELSLTDHSIVIAEHAKTLEKKMVDFLLEPVESFSDNPNLTWKQWEHAQKVERERVRHEKERSEIVAEFKQIQKKVVAMINVNKTLPDLKRLPISAFAMSSAYRERLMKAAKDEREEVRLKLEQDIHERNRVSNWIQTQLWDSQLIHFQSVFGIFDDTEVTNYAVGKEVFLNADCVTYAAFARRVTSDLIHNETVYPWDTRTPEELNLLFDKQIRLIRNDGDENPDGEEDSVIGDDPEEELNKKLFDGLTAYKFIEQSNYYSQFRYYSFFQIKIDNDNAFSDGEKLRNYFNKKFDEITFIKEREMSTVEERIDRINFIITELQTMFNETIAKKFEYPKWHMKERPEEIIQVSNEEISAEMYLTQSEQDLLNKQAAEEQRLRQAKLADDFRERALQDMMDGVLEKHWTDVIKKEIPKPDCMLLKTPDRYTEEDKLAVQRYEQDLKNLEENRETYRKTLRAEFAKVNQTLKQSIGKFNARLREFHVMRLRLDSAILQLDLRRCRYSLRHGTRVKELYKVDDLKSKIKEKYQLVSGLSENVSLLKNVDLVMQENYENLGVKDKYMERKLKNDFPTLSKTAFDALNKQYKRRPRIFIKTVSPHEVTDLAKSIISMVKPSYMTKECLEYLKQLGNLDVRPQGLPDSVEPTHWENLVALRRLKIANELRLHASLLEMLQVEQNLAVFADKLARERGAIESMKNYLIEARRIRVEHEVDNEIQLVLKFGQVEVPNFHGDLGNDTVGTVLVPKVTLDTVNQAILSYGDKKVTSLEKFVEFRKHIIMQKWKNECLETRLRHTGADMYFIQVTPVTRSIREYLKRRANKIKEDNSEKRMEREFMKTKKGQEMVLEGWKMRLDHTTREIDRIKRKNAKLDIRIEMLNVDRCEREFLRDFKGEARYKEYKDRVIKLIIHKSRLMRKLVASYEELMTLREEYRKLQCGKEFSLKPIEDQADVVICDCSDS